MSLSVGIVGLPNAGKSTLFNALAARRLAETAPRPFTTIDPHEVVVPVPDKDLESLSELIKPQETAPATEGLGNQFLAKIQEVDAIAHVVRAFFDPRVSHQHPAHQPGSLKQIMEDIEIVNLELELGGISQKPTIYVLNVEEDKVADVSLIAEVEKKFGEKAMTIAAKLEEELIDFNERERRAYLKEAGVVETGLERLILHAYQLLGLISFYTIKGGKEIHAWSIKEGETALEAAEKVHSDFAKNFIKAEVVAVDKLLAAGSWKRAKEEGKVRIEGRDYRVQDKDVIEFKVSS